MSPTPLRGLTSNFTTLEFIYVQSTGAFFLADNEDGVAFIGRGYSGKGSATNDPDQERQIALGPIPRGVWAIRPANVHARLGPVSIPLVPWKNEWDPHGRSGFYIHGDNRHANYSASSGCIILNRECREFVEFCRKRGTSRLVVKETWIFD